VTFFCKGLVLVLLIKMTITWPVAHLIMTYEDTIRASSWLGKILFAPAQYGPAYYGIAIVVSLIIFFARWNYFSAVLFFWLSVNFYRTCLPIVNGSDLILCILAGYTIPLATHPRLSSEKGRLIQRTVFNFSVWLCQIQIAAIYLVSGWNKLVSPVWRSGDAIAMIHQMDFVIHPALHGGHAGDAINQAISWSAIAFELAFAVLIWFRKTRGTMLVLGIVFHVIIAVALSLPDFALVMIISYLLFLDDGLIASSTISRLHNAGRRFFLARKFDHTEREQAVQRDRRFLHRLCEAFQRFSPH